MFKNKSIILLLSTLVSFVLVAGVSLIFVNRNNSNTNANSSSVMTSSVSSSELKSSEESKSLQSEQISSSSANSSSSSSMSSSNTSSKQSETVTEKKYNTYSNPFFDNFKLVYPEDWKFTTKTENSVDNLVNRTINLTKGKYNVQINTGPILQTGCGVDPDYYTVRSEKLLGSSIVKREMSNPDAGDYILYDLKGSDYICNITHNLESNLKAKNFPEYSKLNYINDDSNVMFNMGISTNNIEVTDKEIIAEVDDFLARSSFGKIVKFGS
jgi:hypothetical protein